jgi:hypothetical protein
MARFTLVRTDSDKSRSDWMPEPVKITAQAILEATESGGAGEMMVAKVATDERLVADMPSSAGERIRKKLDLPFLCFRRCQPPQSS